MAVLIAVLIGLLQGALSALIVCGLVSLICLGFGFHFTWWVGLGIWAIIILFKVVFK